MKKLLILIFFQSFAFILSAQTFTVGYHSYTITSSNTVQLTSSVQTTGELTLLSSVIYNGKTYSVTRIGGSAFYMKTGIYGTINIPNSVVEIGEGAFVDCSGITKIIIPTSVKKMEIGAFIVTSHLISNLKEVYFFNTNPTEISAFRPFIFPSNVTVFVPPGTKSIYQTLDWLIWSGVPNITEINSINTSQQSLKINDKLSLYADRISITDQTYEKYEATGNVNVNNMLWFAGKVNYNATSSWSNPTISGSEGISVKFSDGSSTNPGSSDTGTDSSTDLGSPGITDQNLVEGSALTSNIKLNNTNEIIRNGIYTYYFTDNSLKETLSTGYTENGVLKMGGLNTTIGDIAINDEDETGVYNPNVTVDYTLFNPPFPINKIFKSVLDVYWKQKNSSLSFIPKEIGGKVIYSINKGKTYSFKINLNKFINFGPVSIDKFSAEYDGLTELYSCGLDVGFNPKPIDVGLGYNSIKDKFIIGLDLSVEQGIIKKMGLSTSTGSNGIVIPNTPLAISKLGMEYTSGVKCNPDTWYFDLYGDLIPVRGSFLNPEILSDPIIWGEHLGFKLGSPCYFNVGGKLKVYKWDMADAKIESGINENGNYIGVQINANIDIADIWKAKLIGSIGTDEMGSYLGCDGILKVPDNLGFFDFLPFAGKELSNVSGEFKNGGISLGSKVEGNDLGIRLEFSNYAPYYKYNFGTNYKDKIGSNSSGVSWVKANIAKEDINAGSYSLLIDENTPLLIISLKDTLKSIPNLEIKTPAGNLLGQTNYKLKFDAKKQTVWYFINKPNSGIWTITPTKASNTLIVTAKAINASPTIFLEDPVKTNNGYTLNLLCNNIIDSVLVRFYYDTDKSGFDGRLISSRKYAAFNEITEQWKTGNVNSGEYYIYCIIDDGKSIPVKIYCNEFITVKSSNKYAPTNLTLSTSNKKVELNWNNTNEKALAYSIIYLKNITTNETLTFNSDTSKFLLPDSIFTEQLKYNILIQNVDTLNNWSEPSNIVEYIRTKAGNNKPSFISENEWLLFSTNHYQEYELNAIDPDNDKLTYNIIDNKSSMSLKDNVISWNPSSTDIGVYKVKFTVSDGEKSDTIVRIVQVNSSSQSLVVKFNSNHLFNGSLNTITLFQPDLVSAKFENLIFINKRTLEKLVIPALNVSDNTFQSVLVLTNNDESFMSVLDGDTIVVNYTYKGVIYNDYSIYDNNNSKNIVLSSSQINKLKTKFIDIIKEKELSKDINESGNIVISQSPNIREININMNNKDKGFFNIEIIDLTGKLIYLSNEYISTNSYCKKINLYNFNTGNYLVKVSSLKFKEAKLFILK